MNRRNFLKTIATLPALSQIACYEPKISEQLFLKQFETIEELVVEYSRLCASEIDYGRELSPTEGLVQALVVAHELSIIFDSQISPKIPLHYSDENAIKILLDEATSKGQNPISKLQTSSYIPDLGLFICQSDTRQNSFPGAYAHELSHDEHVIKGLNTKLAQTAAPIISAKLDRNASVAYLTKTIFIRSLSEGMARAAQEKVTQRIQNPHAARLSYEDILNDLMPVYLSLLDQKGKKPHPIVQRDEIRIATASLNAQNWGYHEAGTTMVKIMQTHDPHAHVKLYKGDASPLERMF